MKYLTPETEEIDVARSSGVLMASTTQSVTGISNEGMNVGDDLFFD